jgi:hypothetical protein
MSRISGEFVAKKAMEHGNGGGMAFTNMKNYEESPRFLARRRVLW